jgi:hypothetical protein
LWWCFCVFRPAGIHILYDYQTTNRNAAGGGGLSKGVLLSSTGFLLRRIFQASLRNKRSKGYFVRHLFTLCAWNVRSVQLNKWWNGCNYLVYFRLFY